jgi:hypothetical protein
MVKEQAACNLTLGCNSCTDFLLHGELMSLRTGWQKVVVLLVLAAGAGCK